MGWSLVQSDATTPTSTGHQFEFGREVKGYLPLLALFFSKIQRGTHVK
jgi:hypothetical protein